jgi:MFS family permease
MIFIAWLNGRDENVRHRTPYYFSTIKMKRQNKDLEGEKMSKESRFYVILKVLTGCIATINLGVCTNFLLQKNIDIFQLSVIYSLILGTSLFFEYLSGNWADRYGRKKIYAFGLIFTAIQYFFYASFSTIYLLYLGSLCGGFGDALISGSFEAWLTQTEKKARKKENSLDNTFALSRSLISISAIGASFFVGLFLKFNFIYFYWVGALTFGILAVITLMLFNDNCGNKASNLSYTIGSLKTFIGNPIYIILSIILAAAFSSFSIFILFWQPQTIRLGIPSNKLPLVYAVYLIGTAISSNIFRQLGKKIGVWIILLSSFFLLSLSFGIMYFAGNVYVHLFGLFIYGIGFGSIIPLFFSWAARIVNDDQCASLLSLINGISSLASVITTIIVGRIIQYYGISAGAVLGLLLGILNFIMILVIRYVVNKSKVKYQYDVSKDGRKLTIE